MDTTRKPDERQLLKELGYLAAYCAAAYLITRIQRIASQPDDPIKAWCRRAAVLFTTPPAPAPHRWEVEALHREARRICEEADHAS